MTTVTKARVLILGLLSSCALASATFAEPETETPIDPPEDQPEAIENPAAAEPASASPAGIDARAIAHERFLRLSDEQRYEEAVEAALQVVELTQTAFGPDALQMGKALINLATMQFRNGDLILAETNYKRSIGIIEKYDGKLSSQLINPLTGLGATYNEAGMYEQAIAVFERALRINHVNEGFYNFSQFKIQDGLTESYVGLQDIEEANFFQEAQAEIYQRRSGIDDPAIVPGLTKLADWYSRSGQIDFAMLTLRKADSLIRKKGGGDSDPARITTLEGIADVYERGGNQSASASTLKKAITVASEQPEIDYRRRAGVLVKLGDLYMRNGKPTQADEQYAAAWRDLSLHDDYLDQRDGYFSNPVRVAGRQLASLRYAPNARGKPAELLSEGYVLISYGVKANGRARDVKVIESDPPDIMDKSLVSTFSRSHFRPRREDGVAVEADRLLYQLDFLFARERAKKTSKPADGRLEPPEPESRGSGDTPIEYPQKVQD